jgi:VIT1/CCC1 family predicted Fe2+/Mn2+ transporter
MSNHDDTENDGSHGPSQAVVFVHEHPEPASSSCDGGVTTATERMKEEHLGSSRQYWRDIILGVNDGLVSTFLLVAAVAGGGLSSSRILLTALAGALAGAISMAAGEFTATRSQNQVLSGELKLEKNHVHRYLEEELVELEGLLDMIGIPPSDDDTTNLRQALLSHYRNHPDDLLKIMTSLEFGVVDTEKRSPISAALVSGGLFTLGSLPSIIPFIFSGDEPILGMILAGVITTVCLLLVGAVKTWATRGNWITAAIENLIIAGCGGAIAYFVGLGFDMLIGGRENESSY